MDFEFSVISFSVFISIRSDNDFLGSYYNGFPSTLTALFERTYDSDVPSCFFTNVSYDAFATDLLSESFFEAVPYLPSNVFTEENRHVRIYTRFSAYQVQYLKFSPQQA